MPANRIFFLFDFPFFGNKNTTTTSSSITKQKVAKRYKPKSKQTNKQSDKREGGGGLEIGDGPISDGPFLLANLGEFQQQKSLCIFMTFISAN